jgi:hypothetical protein
MMVTMGHECQRGRPEGASTGGVRAKGKDTEGWKNDQNMLQVNVQRQHDDTHQTQCRNGGGDKMYKVQCSLLWNYQQEAPLYY